MWIRKFLWLHNWTPWTIETSVIDPLGGYGTRVCSSCGIKQEYGYCMAGVYTSKVPWFCRGKK